MKMVDVLRAEYPPGPYRKGRSVISGADSYVEVELFLACGHSKHVSRRVLDKIGSKVEAPPGKARCRECEDKP